MVDRPSSLVKRGFVTGIRKPDGRSERVRRRGGRGIRNEASREPAGSDTARLCTIAVRVLTSDAQHVPGQGERSFGSGRWIRDKDSTPVGQLLGFLDYEGVNNDARILTRYDSSTY